MPTIFEKFKRRLTTGQREREEDRRQQSIQTPLQTQQLPQGVLTEEQRLQSVERQPNIITGGTPEQRLQSFEGQPQTPAAIPAQQEVRQPTAQDPTFHGKTVHYSVKTPHPTTGATSGSTATLDFATAPSRDFEMTEDEWSFMNANRFTVAPAGNQELADYIQLRNEQDLINRQIRGDNVTAILNNYFERRFTQENPELAEALKAEVLLRQREFDVPAIGWTWDNVVGVAGEIIQSVVIGTAAGAATGAGIGSVVPGAGTLAGGTTGAIIGAIGGLARAPGIASKRVQTSRDQIIEQVAVARQQEREFLTQSVNQVNMGGNKEDALRDFEESVIELQEKQAWAKEATTGIFGQELQKGRKDLQEITRILEQEVPRLRTQLEDAMINPNGQMLEMPTPISFQNS
jgi:gas vesicle protein